MLELHMSLMRAIFHGAPPAWKIELPDDSHMVNSQFSHRIILLELENHVKGWNKPQSNVDAAWKKAPGFFSATDSLAVIWVLAGTNPKYQLHVFPWFCMGVLIWLIRKPRFLRRQAQPWQFDKACGYGGYGCKKKIVWINHWTQIWPHGAKSWDDTSTNRHTSAYLSLRSLFPINGNQGIINQPGDDESTRGLLIIIIIIVINHPLFLITYYQLLIINILLENRGGRRGVLIL